MYVPILLATSPFAATRSVPTTTAWTSPRLITWPAMLSVIRVTGMLSCTSSHETRCEIWPRLVCDYGYVLASIYRSANNSECGAPDAARRERTGVAVRQHRIVIVEKLAAEFGDQALCLDVFVMDGLGVGEQCGLDVADGLPFRFGRLKRPFHTVDRPKTG